MRKMIKRAIKILVFISLVNLPFITVAQLIGMDTFLNSFENPEDYIYLQGGGFSMEPHIKNGDYIIIQRSSHPSFSVKEGDVILYCKDKGETVCHRVYHINCIGPLKRYDTIGDNNTFGDKPIYENQILGKVVGIVDNNLWNTISMKIWDITIHDLNVKTLLTDN